jgi:hypothetical protein
VIREFLCRKLSFRAADFLFWIYQDGKFQRWWINQIRTYRNSWYLRPLFDQFPLPISTGLKKTDSSLVVTGTMYVWLGWSREYGYLVGCSARGVWAPGARASTETICKNTGQAHSQACQGSRGVRDGTIQRHAYVMYVGWFNIYFHNFHTVRTFENCKNSYSWHWFFAVARKLVFLVSHSGWNVSPVARKFRTSFATVANEIFGLARALKLYTLPPRRCLIRYAWLGDWKWHARNNRVGLNRVCP